MSTPVRCLLCGHHFEADAPAHVEFVTCPACRLRVPVPRPETPEEEIPTGEFAEEDVRMGDCAEGELLEPLPGGGPPRRGPAGVALPRVGLLRPWDYTVVSRSATGRTLTY